MDKDGAGFEEVLREAQEKGYAERNPAADVEGYDACRKIAILSSLMIGKNVKYEEIYTEGITKITAEDFKYAALLGKSIKLLAQSRETDKGYVAMVAPFMIDKEHPLYSVMGVYNAIFIQSNMLGNSMYYGRGAGKLPTASAVVSDIVDCARHIGKTITCIWEQEDVKLADVKESSRRFFVRVGEGSEETVKELFGNREFLRVIEGEFGFVTDEMTEKEFERKAEALSDLITRIRMEA